jgi:transcriptional regulator with XRE-family HTH domain
MAKRKTNIRHAEIVQRFAVRLRELRHSRGMTQAELAQLAHVTLSYIGRLENGGAAPGIDLADRLAAALGASITDLTHLAYCSDGQRGCFARCWKLPIEKP